MRKLTLLLFSHFIALLAFSQSLVPDSSFGTNGITISNFSNDFPIVSKKICLSPAGKIICGTSAGLVRLSENGIPDSSFNGTGVLRTYADGLFAVQQDGKIIKFDSDTTIVRITADGYPDLSFGINGIVPVNIAGKATGFWELQTAADDKIILIGQTFNPLTSADEEILVERLLPNGQFDTSFNHTGIINSTVETFAAVAYGAVIQTDGKIVVRGTDLTNSTSFLIRFNEDGSRDHSFNNNSYTLVTDVAPRYVSVNAIAVTPENTIWGAGIKNGASMVFKCKQNGTFDSSFGTNGILLMPVIPGSGIFYVAKILGTFGDKIVFSGGLSNSSSGGPSLMRLNSNGSPDATFWNSTGTVAFSSTLIEAGAAAVLLPNGKVMFTGTANGNSFLKLARIATNGAVDVSFGASGSRTLKLIGTDEIIHTMLLQGADKIIAGGYGNGFPFVRYTASGVIDSSFGNAGRVNYNNANAPINDSYLHAVLQPDGKIIGYGLSATYVNRLLLNYKIFRLTANGVPDYTFGTASLYTSGEASRSANGKNVTVQSDNKIIYTYNNTDTPSCMCITRLLANGVPDNSFGINGTAKYCSFGPQYSANSIVANSDGKILVSAAKSIGSKKARVTLFRFLGNGNPDSSFGNNGINELNLIIDSVFWPIAMKVMPDKKIVCVTNLSESSHDAPNGTIVCRLTDNGVPDSSFNTTGYIQVQADSVDLPDLKYQDFIIQPDSSIYISCIITRQVPEFRLPENPWTYVSTVTQQGLLHIRANGTIDSTIASDGTGLYKVNGANVNVPYYTGAVVGMPNGRVVAGHGIFNHSTGNDFMITSIKKLAFGEYRFIGNGNWSDPGNWAGGLIPPSPLPSFNVIYIDPVTTGNCILDVIQHLSKGTNLVVGKGKNFIINGNLVLDR